MKYNSQIHVDVVQSGTGEFVPALLTEMYESYPGMPEERLPSEAIVHYADMDPNEFAIVAPSQIKIRDMNDRVFCQYTWRTYDNWWKKWRGLYTQRTHCIGYIPLRKWQWYNYP